MAEIVKLELWVPNAGYEFDLEYPVPTIEELQTHWEAYLEEHGRVIAAPGVYGVVRQPTERPTAYASVDLCEVVRQTSAALRSVENNQPNWRHEPRDCVHCYAGGLAISGDVVPVVQTLMNHDLVPPTDGVERIGNILREWRSAGVYVFANTSTLPGCELSTIRFFGTHLPGAFDGMLLPRNYDGSLPLTKGVAARNLLDAFGEGQAGTSTTAIHIDDHTHHNAGFRDAMRELPGVSCATFQPRFPSCRPMDAGSTQTGTPLEAFVQADIFLRTSLAV